MLPILKSGYKREKMTSLIKVKPQTVGVCFIPHRLFVPQGYDLKAFELIGHLLTVDPPLPHIGDDVSPYEK